MIEGDLHFEIEAERRNGRVDLAPGVETSVAAANLARRALFLVNVGDTVVFLGLSGSAAPFRGVLLGANHTWSAGQYLGSVHAYCEGDGVVSVLEL